MTQSTSTMTARATASSPARSGFQVAGNAAERYEQSVAEFMLGWSEDLVDLAAVRIGERVVDLAVHNATVSVWRELHPTLDVTLA